LLATGNATSPYFGDRCFGVSKTSRTTTTSDETKKSARNWRAFADDVDRCVILRASDDPAARVVTWISTWSSILIETANVCYRPCFYLFVCSSCASCTTSRRRCRPFGRRRSTPAQAPALPFPSVAVPCPCFEGIFHQRFNMRLTEFGSFGTFLHSQERTAALQSTEYGCECATKMLKVQG
jgi:hypothetical protein